MNLCVAFLIFVSPLLVASTSMEPIFVLGNSLVQNDLQNLKPKPGSSITGQISSYVEMFSVYFKDSLRQMYRPKPESSGLVNFLKSHNISTKLPQAETLLPIRYYTTVYSNTATRYNQSYIKQSSESHKSLVSESHKSLVSESHKSLVSESPKSLVSESPKSSVRLARSAETTKKSKNNLVSFLKVVSRLLSDTCLKNVVCEIGSMLEQMHYQSLVGTFLALGMPLFPPSRMQYVEALAVGLVGDGCVSVQC